MKKNSVPQFTAGLDMGTTHVTLVVGQNGADNNINILGAARTPHTGIKKGAVTHLEDVSAAIQDAIDEAERQTGLNIETARITMSSSEGICENIHETVQIKTDDIKIADLKRLKQQLSTHKANLNMEFVHILEGSFIVDGKGGISNPIGLFGKDLGAIFHRVQYPISEIQNRIRACHYAGLAVESVVSESIATAEAVLDCDEKELGVCSINIGCSLTHVAVYTGGTAIYSRDFPFGSNHISKDLSIGLRTSQTEAERIKKEHGRAIYAPHELHEEIEIFSLESKAPRILTRSSLQNIIEPRVHEILKKIHAELSRQNLIQHMPKGLVLSGGGSLLSGICIVAEDIFGGPARLGLAQSISGMVEGLRNPATSTAVGLLAPRFSQFPSNNADKNSEKSAFRLATFTRSLVSRLADTFG